MVNNDNDLITNTIPTCNITTHTWKSRMNNTAYQGLRKYVKLSSLFVQAHTFVSKTEGLYT